MNRLGLLRLVVAACATLCAPAFAQDAYPSRGVRIVMPFPPGSSTDTLARIVADELQREWKQSVVVENVVGGASKIGVQTVYRAAPDGYTLLFAPPPPLVINHVMIKDWGVDPATWEPVSILASVPYTLDARADFPANDVPGFVAYAKANPGKITYMSGGVGATAQLSMLQIEKLTGASMVHVPYRGAAPALVDLMGGHVDVGFDTISTSIPPWQAGRIKILGVGGVKRSPEMPDVPTIAEQGLPGFQSIIWFGMVAPPRTPAAIVAKISADVAAILRRPDMEKRLRSFSLDIVAANPADSRKWMDAEMALWGKIVTDAGISLD